MRLHRAALYFDRDLVYDAYSGEFLFKAQFSSFDGSQPDGAFQRRRTMSMAPAIELPPHGAIEVSAEKWLVGTAMSDGFFGKPIRKNSSCRLVTHELQVLTPGQAADHTRTGANIYGHLSHLKVTTDGTRSSDQDPQYEVYLGANVGLATSLFLASADSLLSVRAVVDVAEGFRVAIADELYKVFEVNIPDPTPWGTNGEVQATFQGVKNPVTELAGPATVVPALIFDAYKLFSQPTQSSDPLTAGDYAMLVSKAKMPNIPVMSQTVTVSDISYQMLLAQPFHDAWLIRLRRR